MLDRYDRYESFQFLSSAKGTNNVIQYLKLGKKKRESSKNKNNFIIVVIINCLIISPKVTIQAFTITKMRWTLSFKFLVQTHLQRSFRGLILLLGGFLGGEAD